MNFNPNSGHSTPNPHPSQLSQQQQQQQQQQFAAAAARQRQKMAMLPPQFQNLSPQQLSELKNQPQFQNMLRQYIQRQQMMQQQQMAQSQMMSAGSAPGMAPNGQQGHNINMAPGNGTMGTGMPPNFGQNMNTGVAQNIGDFNSSVNGHQGAPSHGMAAGFKAGVNTPGNLPQNPQMGASSAHPQQLYNKNMQAAFLQQQQSQNLAQSRASPGQASRGSPIPLQQAQQQAQQQQMFSPQPGNIPQHMAQTQTPVAQQPLNQQQYSQQQLQRMQQMQQNVRNQRAANAAPAVAHSQAPVMVGGAVEPILMKEAPKPDAAYMNSGFIADPESQNM
ncbi:hypothetical protein OXX69_007603, partial [Metschnikowia pulcherrima]